MALKIRSQRRTGLAVVLGVVLSVVALTSTVSKAFLGSTAAQRTAAPSTSPTALKAAATAKDYWEGEWICADCGYIYNQRAFGMQFEDLPQGSKCPACAAPRRRFARKLGDKIGTTLDGGDGPILIFTGVALLAVFVIAYYALQ